MAASAVGPRSCVTVRAAVRGVERDLGVRGYHQRCVGDWQTIPQVRGLGVDLVDSCGGGYAGLLGQHGDHGQRYPVDPRGVSLVSDRAVGQRRRP
jgi:hypothetical protein